MTPSIFRKRKRPFLLKRHLIGCSSLGILDVIIQGTLVWVFGMTPFLSKRDSVLCIRVRQRQRKHLTLKCYTCYQRSIMIEKIGFPSVWSCLPSERGSARSGLGTDMMLMEPCAEHSLCEKRGVCWAICGTFSPSNLESSMRDTMSSCSGGMSK